jgi:hypothetical protein
MAKLSLSAIGRTTKQAVVRAIKGASDTVESVVEATRDVLMATVASEAG